MRIGVDIAPILHDCKLSLLFSFPSFQGNLSTVEFQWLEHWWLYYNGCFELVLEFLGKNPIAADLG